MKNKNLNSLKATCKAFLLYLTAVVFFLCNACKKSVENNSDIVHGNQYASAKVTSATTSSPVVDNVGFSCFEDGNNTAIVELSFTYNGNSHVGYVSISGSAASASQTFSGSLRQGINTSFGSVLLSGNGTISATINIDNNSYSLGTANVYSVPSSNNFLISPLPSTVQLASFYKSSSAFAPGQLILNFRWEPVRNSKFPNLMLYSALKAGQTKVNNRISYPYTYQSFSAPASDGFMQITFDIPRYENYQYLQIAFCNSAIGFEQFFSSVGSPFEISEGAPFYVTDLQGNGLASMFIDNFDFKVWKYENGILF